MHYSFTTLIYFFTLTWYYLRCGILTPIAHLLNKSFLINHPDRLFPTIIAPPRNKTIHSLIPTGEMYKFIMTRSSPPSTIRRWLNPQDLRHTLSREPPLLHAIILDGELSGPPLRQGILVIQSGHLVYIQDELGRWPTRDDYITTSAISLTLNNTFRLFLPVHQVDRYGLQDDSPLSPFRNPLPLTYVFSEADRLQNQPLPSPANV